MALPCMRVLCMNCDVRSCHGVPWVVPPLHLRPLRVADVSRLLRRFCNCSLAAT